MAPTFIDDHITPRKLTNLEIWHAWEHFDQLPKDVLYGLNDFQTPSMYPPLRLTYYRTAPAVSADLHSLRLSKMAIWEFFERLKNPFGDDPAMGGMMFRMSLQGVKYGESNNLKAQLDKVETKREGANKLYRQGKFQDAMEEYTKAWKDVLPHYVESLSETDTQRPRLGYFEAVLFANMAATCIALAKTSKTVKQEKGYLRMAFQCAWVTWEMREFAAAITVRNATLRSSDVLRRLYQNSKDANHNRHFEQMAAYFSGQAEALEGVNKEQLFKDIEESKRLPPPPIEALHAFGPRAWAQRWIKHIPGTFAPYILSPPPVSTLEERKKPRDLTPFELWAAWDEMPEEHREDLNETKMPLYHPQTRLTHSLTTPAQRTALHFLRQAKFHVFRTVMSTAAGDSEFDAIVKMIKDKPVDQPSLEHKLAEAEMKKAQANKLYRKKEFPNAFAEYFFAWSVVLPYHTDALPAGDPLRIRLGKFESALWCNLAATFIAVSKDPLEEEAKEGFRDLACKCAWASFAEREYATVNSVKHACLRARDTFFDQSSQSGPSFVMTGQQPDASAPGTITNFFSRQAEKLEGLPKDMLFADVEASRKVKLPDAEVWDKYGPQMWLMAINTKEMASKPFTYL
ncbi:hypothetical protein I350_03215 [Cryptococcus amylolentus CBS 6273]|uniref:Uncharacterized protein n=1 Tax=Cryptococcus amylolentus CBS 6273 TaxID=1296118 RepID=A0A1E3KAN8_9TREE|nr:hypothetical protein I350_03215 [Cryptococcus amylolentus CBS 6273]